ncbi:anion transporter [Candidatus Deferrimicrobium sp.]|uniref:anion transporter n=1 Tax=Candidatus Deferrimicrobium sp. TaxID=3060586 RepID=UPI003C4615A3
MIAALLIFLGTYIVLTIGRLPGFRIDRTGAAIIGASLMIAFRVLTMDEAIRSINHETLILLFGMMIVVANLRLSGFFAMVSAWVVEHTHHPLALLAAIVLVSGILSAFFVNDTMCLVLTPLVLDIVTRLRRNPIPYLLAVAMAANIGSAATITGNPQNMMIGTFSQIPYRTFAAAIGPISAIGLILTVGLIAMIYRREFIDVPRIDIEKPRVRVNTALLWKSVAAAGVMIILFFLGFSVSKVAVVTGAILLITRRVKPEKVYREIDWSLLVLFAGLFVIIAGVEKTLLTGDILILVKRLQLDRTGVLTVWSAILSNLVSNVPAVLVFKPFISTLRDPQHAWLTLAMSSTLAGNLTVLGSIANLIVIERSRRTIKISFFEYLKVGVPLTLLTLWVGVLFLS